MIAKNIKNCDKNYYKLETVGESNRKKTCQMVEIDCLKIFDAIMYICI